MAGFFDTHKGWKITGIVIAAIIVLLIAETLVGGTKKSTNIATSTPSTPTIPVTVATSRTTVAARSTTTTMPAAGNPSDALLGGTQADWQARYGPPDPKGSYKDHDGFIRCGNDTPMPNILQWLVDYDSGKATIVTYQSCSTEDLTQDFDQALLYLPKDTKIQGPMTHETAGEDDYTLISPSLGSEFPASTFSGCGGTAVTPGTIMLGVDDTGWSAIMAVCVS